MEISPQWFGVVLWDPDMLTFTRWPLAPRLEEQTQEEETLRHQIETAILPPTRLISV
jgi:hypothetical protein